MKRNWLMVVWIVFLTGGLAAPTFFVSAEGEHIDLFSARIEVQPDATILVRETIDYDFGMNERHGIFRDIPINQTTGTRRLIEIEVLAVVDEANKQYPSSVEYSEDVVHIKIGDPNVLVQGKHQYKIYYKVLNAIGRFNDRDEIYWNITGNDWEVPIWGTYSEIVLPEILDSEKIQIASYCGKRRSTARCGDSEITYASDRTMVTMGTASLLSSGEGVTMAVGFPIGVVAYEAPLSFFEKVTMWISRNWQYIAPWFVVGIWFRGSLHYWIRRRAYYKKNTIIPEYDAQGFGPLEVQLVTGGEINDQAVSAHIIYLATQGYLHITKEGDEFLFVRTEKDISQLSAGSQQLLTELNTKRSGELEHQFVEVVQLIRDEVTQRLEKDGLIESSMKIPLASKAGTRYQSLASKIVVSLFFAINPGIFVWIILGWRAGFTFSAVCILIGLAMLIFRPRIGRRLTEFGFEKERYLLGLKHYIEVAEKERIKFLNAPEKNPELFERLLPFAIVFGQEKQWAAQFESLYNTVSPTWYSDTGLNHLSFMVLTTGISRFSERASAMYSPVRSSGGSSGFSSGSSGGGSSGGGGGGGGGGSW